MSEELYRGQTRRYGEKVRKRTGEKVRSKWVWGVLVRRGEDKSVIYADYPAGYCEVYSDTVCRFTGVVGEYGRRIFEGDVVIGSYRHFDDTGITTGKKIIVVNSVQDFLAELRRLGYRSLKVIGNIHDNPELSAGLVTG